MTDTREDKVTFDTLVPVLQEHVSWIGRVMRTGYYPQDPGSPQEIPAPQSLIQWGEVITDTPVENSPTFNQMIQQHNALSQAAKGFIEKSHAGQPLTAADYDMLYHSFEMFMAQVMRMGQEISGIDKAIDPETGLRLPASITKDIHSELERRSRKGNPFCVSILRVDQLEQVTKQHGDDGRRAVLAGVAAVILGTVRTFDDAYRLEDDQVLLCLKLADIVDGKSVLERVRGMIADRDMPLFTGQTVRVTVSCGVSEPVPGDEPEDAIGNARTALKEAIGMGGDAVAEYEEVSALVQYARQREKENGGGSPPEGSTGGSTGGIL